MLVEFASADVTTIIGYAASHVEFLDEPRRPSPYQAVFQQAQVRQSQSASQSPDQVDPQPNQVPGAPVSPPTASGSTTEVAKLPSDFLFRTLTEAQGPTDVSPEALLKLPHLRGQSVEVTFAAEGKEVSLASGRDAVRGLSGRGLRIEQQNEGNVLQGNLELHLIWSPESFACYRDGQLLGIWDVSARQFRAPQQGETPPTLKDLPARAEAPTGTQRPPSKDRRGPDTQRPPSKDRRVPELDRRHGPVPGGGRVRHSSEGNGGSTSASGHRSRHQCPMETTRRG